MFSSRTRQDNAVKHLRSSTTFESLDFARFNMLHNVGEAGEARAELFAAANTVPLACERPVAAQ